MNDLNGLSTEKELLLQELRSAYGNFLRAVDYLSLATHAPTRMERETYKLRAKDYIDHTYLDLGVAAELCA